VVFAAEGGGDFQQTMLGQMQPQTSGMLATMSGGIGGRMGMPMLGEDYTAAAATPGGVAVTGVITDASAPLRRYDPQHPDAGPDGYVSYPDINPLTEMVDLMGATRAYGMNATAVQAEKNMVSSSLDILKS
jgi:flagellar basal-body rod protein FlgC